MDDKIILVCLFKSSSTNLERHFTAGLVTGRVVGVGAGDATAVWDVGVGKRKVE